MIAKFKKWKENKDVKRVLWYIVVLMIFSLQVNYDFKGFMILSMIAIGIFVGWVGMADELLDYRKKEKNNERFL